MKSLMRKSFNITIAMLVGIVIGASVSPVEAAFFDRDKLAHAIAIHFHLNEQEVGNFLADFQYNPDKDYTVAIATATPTPTPKPTPTATNNTNNSNSQPDSIVINNTTYEYDDSSDSYIPSSTIVSTQHQEHLDFIKAKLDPDVKSGKISSNLETKILDHLAIMMQGAPSSTEFAKMNLISQRIEVNKFKKELSAWLTNQGTSFSYLSNATGKGAQYMMGIYLD